MSMHSNNTLELTVKHRGPRPCCQPVAGLLCPRQAASWPAAQFGREVASMRVLAVFTIAVFAIALPSSSRSQNQTSSPQRQCDTGPTKKSFGGSPWLLYGCDDRKTVVLVSAPESPAFPFYFTFFPQGATYRLSGEGTGKKEATAAAYRELSALSPAQIASLVTEVNAGAK